MRRSRRRRRRGHTNKRGKGPIRSLAVGGALTAVVAIAAVIVAVAVAAHALGEVAEDREATVITPPPAAPAVAGYGVEQLSHACTIMIAGRDLAMDERDQTIAVMTAMGESSLRNLSYGDWETSGVTNPDGSPTTSIGLFQQQDGWGSREARLDPHTAASTFYRAMALRVPERSTLEPTLVAHLTQVNADPLHYARYWERAVRVVAALNGHPLDRDRTAGIPLCPAS